jgi:exopolysaccharide biosynthesis polyprenyl glycosylphosphotransferase
VATHIAAKLAARPWYGLEVVGFLDDDPLPLDPDGPPYLGPSSKLEAIVHSNGIEQVILAFSRMTAEEEVDLSRRCMDLGVRIDIVPRMFEVIGSQNRLRDLDGLPLVEIQRARLARSSRVLKRCLDLSLASVALVLFAPFMLYAAVRIRLESPGPVFFRQERMGAGGRRFRILKFRTMYADAEKKKAELEHLNRHREYGPRMFKVEDDPRTTPFGKVLRRWSLDELPQLFNVLVGDMSLVGPRPLILDEDKNILGLHRRRLNLLPGITGLWQVLGRSEIPFSEMVNLDYLYVTNWSLWGDIKLLLRTVPVVLARRGAY